MSVTWGINQTHVLSNVSSITVPSVKEQDMSVITSEETAAPEFLRTAAAPGTRQRPRRAGRGSGRVARPQARPPRPVVAPDLAFDAPAIAHGCEVARSAEPKTWRLTERGIALIIAAGMAIAAAALVVVGLTAMRVTGDGFAPSGQISLQR